MKVFYYKAPEGNFGDDLNEWLWRAVRPDLFDGSEDQFTLVGIGTLLGMPMNHIAGTKFVVGTGTGLEPPPPIDESWRILGVRGPLTARALRLPPRFAVGDGALLLRTLKEYSAVRVERDGVAFMPHISAAKIGNWEAACAQAGIIYIDPRSPYRTSIDQINRCRLVLADAMHAAIVADTLRVPWLPLISSCSINTFKWLDWAMVVGAPYRPVRLVHSSAIEALRDLYWPLTGWNHMAKSQILRRYEEEGERGLEEIFNRFHRRASHSWLRRRAHRVAQGSWRRILLPFLESLQTRLVPRSFETINARLANRAADQLRELSRRTGYLSDERKLDAAVARLNDCLDQLAVITRQRGDGGTSRLHTAGARAERNAQPIASPS